VADVNTAWLEQQTGVAYATIRKHYGRWLRTEGESQTRKIAAFAGQFVPNFVPNELDAKISLMNQRLRSARRGT